MTSRVVFPSFAGSNFEPAEMRQLVSALELRFQSLESEGQSLFDTEVVTEGDFASVDHTHTESDITDLQPYLTDISGESIFDLSDVSGSPNPTDVLIWDGAQFVPGPQAGGGGATELDDLTDVSIPAPLDDQVLTYNTGIGQWEAETPSGGAPTHIGEVTGDIDLTVDVTSITNRVDAVADSADDVAIHVNSDGTHKKVNLSSITDAGYF